VSDARQLDAQVAFYLEHEKQIREWQALERPAQAAFSDFMLSLTDDVHAMAAQLGTDVLVTDPNDDAWGAYAVLAMYRQSWVLGDERRPAVSVGFVWHRTKATFRASLGANPCCAIWARVSTDGGALARRLRDEVTGRVPSLDGKREANPQWVAWRAEVPEDDEFWRDLSGYRSQLLARLAQAWAESEPTLSGVVGSSG
jgi:hypothetical protein